MRKAMLTFVALSALAGPAQAAEQNYALERDAARKIGIVIAPAEVAARVKQYLAANNNLYNMNPAMLARTLEQQMIRERLAQLREPDW